MFATTADGFAFLLSRVFSVVNWGGFLISTQQ